MLSTEQIITQLELQSKMNAIVNPDWINAGYPWLRAVMVEGAKAIDHLGYKWWKKQESNMAQVQLELVDIWHFYLSQKLVGCKAFSLVETAQELRRCLDVCFGSHCDPNDRVVEFDDEDYDLSSASLVKLLALIIAFAATGRMCVPAFAFAMKAAGLTPESLHKQYVEKNILKVFRQDNGYKNGTYRKVWAGLEDNEHLTDIVSTMDGTSDNYAEALYVNLLKRYNETA